MKKIKLLILAMLLICTAAISYAQSDVYIGIASRGGNALPKLGIAQFKYDEGSKKAAAQVRDIMRADLMFSRHFDISEKGPKIDTANIVKTLEEWQKNTFSEFVLYGEVSSEGEDFIINIFIYNTSEKKPVFARSYRGKENALRRLSHIASDQVVKELTGKRGIADTRIAFANSATGNKEIYIADYDGANLKKLTTDRSIALLPRWSKDGKIYYTSYRYKNPDVFSIDLAAGKVSPVAITKGLELIGGVSPDGRSIILTRSGGTNPSIFEINLETGKSVQLTDKAGVDGSPSYSPDGRFITFVSNRSGNPQIYVMDLQNGSTRRITSSLNWADTPQWSPTGEWIVFAGRTAAQNPIDIFLVDITGTQIRQLTSDSANNEDPTWSPDGRFIAFTTTRKGRRQLYVMDADGSAPHLLADIPGNSYTPHWSM
ncbi:Putative component of the Tol biopolymer transport system [Elusimicrobium minutum Pei191]|uniref:Putative component of the Tol biopolymer transport system n=1 Tax=Elusimicrobium minutum (strain Pei191) TaxID=445932 RepID=B2KE83_ELUMP|nr:DPP IV N-terminal domain-containing protein [Elusimicrobium minutum]ACC98829.1 Putative component of the Tol biopolymer transport system [Elusimicrobium minutum Pei191]